MLSLFVVEVDVNVVVVVVEVDVNVVVVVVEVDINVVIVEVDVNVVVVDVNVVVVVVDVGVNVVVVDVAAVVSNQPCHVDDTYALQTSTAPSQNLKRTSLSLSVLQTDQRNRLMTTCLMRWKYTES